VIREATVANKPVAEESAKETVTPSRREGRIASAEPVCSCAHLFVQFAHETAGAARTRSSLRPLFSEGQSSGKPRAHRVATMWTHIFSLFEIRNQKFAMAL
jgi:hypothetical protein